MSSTTALPTVSDMALYTEPVPGADAPARIGYKAAEHNVTSAEALVASELARRRKAYRLACELRRSLAASVNRGYIAHRIVDYSIKRAAEAAEHTKYPVYTLIDVFDAMPDREKEKKWSCRDIMLLAKTVREEACIKKYGADCLDDPDKEGLAPKKRKADAAAAAPRKAAKTPVLSQADRDDAQVSESELWGGE